MGMKRPRPVLQLLSTVAVVLVLSAVVVEGSLPPPPPRPPPRPDTTTSRLTLEETKEEPQSARRPPPPPPRRRTTVETEAQTEAATLTPPASTERLRLEEDDEDELTLRLKSILKSKNNQDEATSDVKTTIEQEPSDETRIKPPPPPFPRTPDQPPKIQPRSIHDFGTPLLSLSQQQQRQQLSFSNRKPPPPPPPQRQLQPPGVGSRPVGMATMSQTQQHQQQSEKQQHEIPERPLQPQLQQQLKMPEQPLQQQQRQLKMPEQPLQQQQQQPRWPEPPLLQQQPPPRRPPPTQQQQWSIQQQQQQLPPHMQQRLRPVPPQQGRQRPPPQGSAAGRRQQQLMPYRQGRPQPQRKPQQPWNLLWNKIEKGLDGLADLEEVVSKQAQQLYQVAKERTVVAVRSSGHSRRGDEAKGSNEDDLLTQLWSSSSRSNRRSATNKAAASDDIPALDMSRFQKKVGQPAQTADTTTTTTVPAGSSGTVAATITTTSIGKEQITNLYESTFDAATTTTVSPESSSSDQQQRQTSSYQSARKIHWTDLSPSSKPSSPSDRTSTRMMIRANGGASAPPPHRPFAAQAASSAATVATETRKQKPQTPEKGLSLDYLDDEKTSLFTRINRALPSLPNVSRLNPFHRSSSFSDSYAAATLDAWKAGDKSEESTKRGFLGLFRKSSSFSDIQPYPAVPKSAVSASATVATQLPQRMAAPLTDLMNRCENGKTASLLTATNLVQCGRMGRTQATWDLVALLFLLTGCRQMFAGVVGHSLLPSSLADLFIVTIPGFVQSLILSSDDTTWAPFCFASVFLAVQTRRLLYRRSIQQVIRSVDSAVSEQAQFGALFLRLYTSVWTNSRDVGDKMRTVALAQIAAKVNLARLQTFVTCILAALVWMTLSVLQKIPIAFVNSLGQVAALEEWGSWPPQWKGLARKTLLSIMLLLESLASLIGQQISEISQSPRRFIFAASMAAAFLAVTHLPSIGSKVAIGIGEIEADEDEEAEAQHTKLTEQVSNLGSSSATRLSLLSDNGGIDAALERWRLMIPRDSEQWNGPTIGSLVHLVAKGILSGAVLALPLVVHGYAGLSAAHSVATLIPQWNSLLDIAILLLFTQGLVWKTLLSSTMATDVEGPVGSFLASLASAVNERSKLLTAPPPNLQLQAAVSSAAGIVVTDLWSAHMTKRAWAVRGANLACASGEILVVLGDDSAGKSRLLTTLAEAIVAPPRRALTTNKVRGSISVGGLDVTKWDHRQLQKRVGLLLNDVRTVSDLSQILSGLTLEEILDPSGGVRNFELSQNHGPSERACMLLALQIAGLYSSLLPRLASKLSTVVTASEEDTRPSPLRPHNQILSPVEWSKLLLARVLAQTVYDNDNAIGTRDSVDKCLVGSLLLLDDATLYLSEVDERRFMGELRKTGAVTVLTSSRWATGRFADRIAVMKNGAIVESGTHAELLNRGPQQSIYAAKWHAMTSMS